MLSPLKPLLCRHEFYWSERHRSDLCRRCGKTRAAEAQTAGFDEDFVEGVPETERRRREPSFAINGRNVAEPVESAFFDIPAAEAFQPATTAAVRPSPSAKVLKTPGVGAAREPARPAGPYRRWRTAQPAGLARRHPGGHRGRALGRSGAVRIRGCPPFREAARGQKRADLLTRAVVPAAGFEPATSSLQNWRSTN